MNETSFQHYVIIIVFIQICFNRNLNTGRQHSTINFFIDSLNKTNLPIEVILNIINKLNVIVELDFIDFEM